MCLDTFIRFLCMMTGEEVALALRHRTLDMTYERILQRVSVEDKVLYVYRVYIRMCLMSRVRCTLVRHMKNIFMKNVFMSN